MGYIEGNLVKTTGDYPIFKVNVSSDNSPHCWDTLPTASVKTLTYMGTPLSWITLGAVKDTDITVKNQIDSGMFWKLNTDITMNKLIDNISVHSGLAYLTDKLGVKFGLRVGQDWWPKLEIMLAKKHQDGPSEDEIDGRLEL